MSDTGLRAASRLERTAALTGIILVVAYFLWYAAGGLGAHFSPDDMQNLHNYWEAGWGGSLAAIAQFWSTFYRPLGAAFYLPLYEVAHLNVLPYRAAALALVIVNSVMVWKLLLILTRDRWVTWVAVATWQFHLALFLVYRSNAIIYDILCLLFYTAGLVLYVGPRARNARVSGRRLLAIGGLYVLALDAKEMAVTFPLTLILLELLVFRHGPPRQVAGALRPAAIMTALTTVYVVGKLFGPDPLSGADAYRPVISWKAWSSSVAWYTSQLIYREAAPVSSAVAFGIWAVMLGLAAVVRSRLAGFGLAFAMAALLPVAFIGLRQGFVWYLPMLGVAVWAGCVTEPLFRRAVAVRWLVPVAIALALLPPHRVIQEHQSLLGAQAVTWRFLQQTREAKLRLPRGASVLVKNEPFSGYWDVYFILRLYFDDPSLQVAFSSLARADVQGNVRDSYDVVLRLEEGGLIQERAAPREPGR